jgi:hypothetical protein
LVRGTDFPRTKCIHIHTHVYILCVSFLEAKQKTKNMAYLIPIKFHHGILDFDLGGLRSHGARLSRSGERTEALRRDDGGNRGQRSCIVCTRSRRTQIRSGSSSRKRGRR